MDCIDSVELASRFHVELTTGAVMSWTIKTMLLDAIDDAEEEASMLDMSRETLIATMRQPWSCVSRGLQGRETVDWLYECSTTAPKAWSTIGRIRKQIKKKL